MMSTAGLLLRVGGAVAAGAVVVGAAGCAASPASPSGSATSSASSSVTASSPSSPSASASSLPSSASSTPAAALSPRVVTSATAAAACASAALRVTAGTSEGAAGSVYQVIDFTNTGAAACTLYGYPGVSLASGTPLAQVGAAATRSSTAAPTLVTLAPGATANALLRITQALNYPSATCTPKATTYLQVYPPNQTVAIDLAYTSTGCTSSSVKLLTIGVVQAGAGSAQ